MELLERDLLLGFGFRWLHILVGIAWIGLLYYFNFVQVPGLAAYGDEGKARNITINQIARRALWWFRWAAIATLLTGLLITGQTNYWLDFMNGTDVGHDVAISIGMVLGILMAANVWMVIWKNQKTVLANAVNVLEGKDADPNAATAGRRALLVSRQNMIFSVSMLWFMVGAAHFYDQFGSAESPVSSGDAWTLFIVAMVITALLQLNALGLFGGIKAGNKMLVIYESHRNAIITSFVLWAVLWIASEVLLG